MISDVTLKTEVMMLKIPLCITEINYILKYIQIETVILDCNNISEYYSFYCVFDIINKCSLGEHKTLLSKTIKNPTHPKLFNGSI